MKIIVFDTETTGLPLPHAELVNQPYLCQFAALLLDCNLENGVFRAEAKYNQLIKPPVPISSECSAIHGITETMVADKPAVGAVIDDILSLFYRADIAAAHNLGFDQKLVELELERLGRAKSFLPPQTYDTMKETRDLCRLPGRGEDYKPPRLMELYRFLFGREFESAHDAMIDVLATAVCLKELYNRKIFRPAERSQRGLF